MQPHERAAQIWPVLRLAAKNKQKLTYSDVGSFIGVKPIEIGRYLEPIQSYCLLNELPALTVLVVSKTTGVPGYGFIAAIDVRREQQKVFSHNWGNQAPTPNEFLAAVKELPSCGIPEAASFRKRQD